jgi:hypothetical protein
MVRIWGYRNWLLQFSLNVSTKNTTVFFPSFFLNSLLTHYGFGHTESGLPRRAAICARGGKAFELYYVRLHHPRQTEGGLTRRTSVERGGQRTFVFRRQIYQAGSTDWRKNSLKN